MKVAMDEFGDVYVLGKFDYEKDEIQPYYSKFDLKGKKAKFVCATLKGTIVVCDKETISTGIPSFQIESSILEKVIGVASTTKMVLLILGSFFDFFISTCHTDSF